MVASGYMSRETNEMSKRGFECDCHCDFCLEDDHAHCSEDCDVELGGLEEDDE